MSEPVHKLLRSLLMVWGPGATSAKRGPVWPGSGPSPSLSFSHFLPFSPRVSLSLSGFLLVGPGRRIWSDPFEALLEGSFLYLMDVQRWPPSPWAPESQKEGLKGSRGHKGYTSKGRGTGRDWRPGVAVPTDIRSSLNAPKPNATLNALGMYSLLLRSRASR